MSAAAAVGSDTLLRLLSELFDSAAAYALSRLLERRPDLDKPSEPRVVVPVGEELRVSLDRLAYVAWLEQGLALASDVPVAAALRAGGFGSRWRLGWRTTDNRPMDRYGAETYGERVADLYDDWYQDHPDTQATVERLAELAGQGPVLELGVGTGRLALPLAERGLQVHGIDVSPAMLERLRAKPGGERVQLSVGDMAEVAVEGSYGLVFVAANTLFLLPSQEQQLRCFANVAARLSPDGVFVVEVFVPDPARYRDDQQLGVTRVTVDSVLLTASRHDPVRQRLEAQQIQLGPGAGLRLIPGVLRYAWPSELDLMARLAGLRLRERWGGWRREPFTATSTMHVSVYQHG